MISSTILVEAEEMSDHFHDDHDNHHHVEQENPIYGNINTNVGGKPIHNLHSFSTQNALMALNIGVEPMPSFL